jgi:hypothetical protein
MFPFNLFKKKKIELEEDYDINQSNSQDLNTFPNRNFQEYPGISKEDLILSKLETINAKLDNMNERLKKIEEYAK